MDDSSVGFIGGGWTGVCTPVDFGQQGCKGGEVQNVKFILILRGIFFNVACLR